MGKCVNDAVFLLHDLEEHGMQSSWDWPADLRFALHMGDSDAADLLKWAIGSTLVVPVLIATVRLHADHVRQRRLRALRLLIHMKKVQANWCGMGEMGVTDFGVNRARSYRLVSQEPDAVS